MQMGGDEWRLIGLLVLKRLVVQKKKNGGSEDVKIGSSVDG